VQKGISLFARFKRRSFISNAADGSYKSQNQNKRSFFFFFFYMIMTTREDIIKQRLLHYKPNDEERTVIRSAVFNLITFGKRRSLA
jgi:hypothetical protein